MLSATTLAALQVPQGASQHDSALRQISFWTLLRNHVDPDPAQRLKEYGLDREKALEYSVLAVGSLALALLFWFAAHSTP